MAAREVIADLYAEGRGGIGRSADRTRLSDLFVAGRRPALDSDREVVDHWEAEAEVGDLQYIRAVGIIHQYGVKCVRRAQRVRACLFLCARDIFFFSCFNAPMKKHVDIYSVSRTWGATKRWPLGGI